MNLERVFAEQVCPVCGYQLDFSPWINGVQTERPCPCCGIHFGHDDADAERREATYRLLRRHWISYGKRWWHIPVPSNFNPDEQLARLEQIAEEPPEWPSAN